MRSPTDTAQLILSISISLKETIHYAFIMLPSRGLGHVFSVEEITAQARKSGSQTGGSTYSSTRNNMTQNNKMTRIILKQVTVYYSSRTPF
mmetsp:Transcript_23380/g.42166  ORF Transcript_23380/g.42166 Transcript_23380/m.42166 type:complete len:91 (-) Transcript_23380:29-301(-)